MSQNDINDKILKEILRASEYAVFYDVEQSLGYMSFRGTLSTDENIVVKEDVFHTISFPIYGIKDLATELIKMGIEYEKNTQKNIGFNSIAGRDNYE